MNEYQIFAANKAREFLEMMQEIGRIDKQFSKLAVDMQPNLEKIINGEEALPTKNLGGWVYKFNPRENFNEVFDVYPKLVNAYCELDWILSHSTIDSYLASRNYLKNL
jgi:hypothetical protein